MGPTSSGRASARSTAVRGTGALRDPRWALASALLVWSSIVALCAAVGFGAREQTALVQSRVGWLAQADAVRARLDTEALRRWTSPGIATPDPVLATALESRRLVDEAPPVVSGLAGVWDAEAARVLEVLRTAPGAGPVAAAEVPSARLRLALAHATREVRVELAAISTSLDAAWRGLFALLGLALASSIALALFLHRAERRARTTAEAHAASEERYRRFFEGTRAPLLVVDPADGSIVDANAAASEFYGWPPDRLRSMTLYGLAAVPVDEKRHRLSLCADGFAHYESVHRHADGRESHVEVYAGPYEVAGRQLLFGIVHDVTEQRRLGERLRAAEKMEALGRMAGGVAHDINNLLTVVLGQAQIAKQGSGPAVTEALEEIERSVEQGAAFTSTLLALGRSRAVERVPVDLRTLLADAEPSLRRLLREDLRLEVTFPVESVPVLVEPIQLREALTELVENAVDAIRGPGTIQVAAVAADETLAYAEGASEAGPGPWAVVRVADTGCGIPPEHRSHLFEPFFTTKPRGHGRGLGLATVYGIAKQNGGTVTVESAPGVGTTFTLWLPRSVEPDELGGAAAPRRELARGPSRRRAVLLAEDDPQLRGLFSGVLAAKGWEVVAVADGTEAIERWRAAAEPFDVLVTDVVMPRLGGPRLAALLRAERPTLPIVFVTGWADEAPPAGDAQSPQVLLRKPFRPSELAVAVERVAGPAVAATSDAPPRVPRPDGAR